MTKAETDAILAAIRDELHTDTPPAWFARWQAEVYGPGITAQKDTRVTAAGVLSEQHAEEGAAAADRWKKNEEAHADIIGQLQEKVLPRLDALNGWRNKVMGVSTFVVFCGPLAVALWALLTR